MTAPRKLLTALEQINGGQPDEKLGPALDRSVPDLVSRGWLQICGCSDGDYVVVTKAGREALEARDALVNEVEWVEYPDETEEEPWCETCSGMGEVNCYCGGDLCICENYGSAPCPDCGGGL